MQERTIWKIIYYSQSLVMEGGDSNLMKGDNLFTNEVYKRLFQSFKDHLSIITHESTKAIINYQTKQTINF